ncbi:hypothetical protein NE236_04730 [Actinoallomurus purpureus]|uniref:hypothetical protein n=1 Tax=Actinoallomurus purpureus TaxID=478114 RepID=UPI00209347A4|nr:hypothetical protein [Actinoallomurus purpureus]MCO6004278.1 hypothetical protein [Actinoallomurus purpureus]
MSANDGLLFGIYPGGAAGDDTGGLATGPADDPERIRAALDRLRPDGRDFLVRGYVSFVDADDTRKVTESPERVEQYAGDGRVLDLVAQYQSRSGDVTGYTRFARELVRRHGHRTVTLQVTEEPNVPGNPTLDGYYPRVREALVEGVLAAADEARRQGFGHLQVGFNTTPLFGPGADFIASLTDLGGKEFVDALGYVGLDFFPDVFQSVPLDQLHDAVTGLLGHHRAERLTPAGIAPEVPLHITENGWPTGPDRSPERQAEVLEATVRAIAECRVAHNIGAYTHFALRDADSTVPGLFHQFGLLADDYRPKPAFATYQELIARFGG